MQRQRGWFDPFPETVDLNQGPVSNNTGMDQPNAWNNMLNPVESRLSSYALSSSEANYSCVNAIGHSARSFGGWDVGESSSSANPQDQPGNDGLKMEHGYFRSGPETRLDERQFESSNPFLHDNFDSSLGGNLVSRGPFSMQSSGSSHIPMAVNLNNGYDGGHGMVADEYTNFYKSGRPESEASASSAGAGTSSGNTGYLVDNDGASGSCLGSWGLSCKRKALEGTSAQSFPGGSSSCFPQTENIVQPSVPARFNASSSLSISNPPTGSRPEQMNPRIGVGMRGVASDSIFPPSSVPGIAESSQRHFGVRLNPGHHESAPFNLSSSGNPVRRPISLNDFLDSRPTASLSTNSTNPSNLPHLMHVPGLPRNMLPFHWNGSMNSRAGSTASTGVLPGERDAESSFRSTLRNNNLDHPNFVSAPETRNLVQDPTNWSLATGNSSTNGGVPSSSRNGLGPSSSLRSFPTLWIPHHNNATQQRVSEFSPWTLFPSAEPESGGQRGHFTPFPSGSSSSSSEETVISSGVNSQGHHQTFPRSAMLMEVPGDDWRALAADMEGRQRLVSEIRQVLNAMRRGENLRPEDYMLFDPFINGVAELHDRHRDMRLDVDNMSYEELLALEERIGNVNTGLSEEAILKTMKQRKHISFILVSPPNLEPCCVCQEEYATGDDIGTLDCGHDFHTDCIKQWLTQKNLCPICKMTGLDT